MKESYLDLAIWQLRHETSEAHTASTRQTPRQNKEGSARHSKPLVRKLFFVSSNPKLSRQCGSLDMPELQQREEIYSPASPVSTVHSFIHLLIVASHSNTNILQLLDSIKDRGSTDNCSSPPERASQTQQQPSNPPSAPQQNHPPTHKTPNTSHERQPSTSPSQGRWPP